MSPGSARKKKGIGRDIRVERKNKFELLVNGGDLLLCLSSLIVHGN
jgi:hypothetical protein